MTTRAIGSDSLDVSPSRFYEGLCRLRDLGCIEIDTGNRATTIKVCNYSTYQSENGDEQQPEEGNNKATTTTVLREVTYGEKNNEKRDMATTKQQLISLDKEDEEERKAIFDEPKPQEFDPLHPSFPPELKTPAFPAAWSDWINYRRERRLSCREMTLCRQLKFLAQFGESGAIESIETTIRCGWQGLFEPPSSKEKTKAGGKPGLFDSLINFAKGEDAK